MRSSTTLPRSRTTPATSCWSSSITGWTRTPKYSIKECKERDATYAAPLYVTARLFNKQTGEVKEQEIFMGDFPLMTDAGTFISNGAERAIVSQLVRSSRRFLRLQQGPYRQGPVHRYHEPQPRRLAGV